MKNSKIHVKKEQTQAALKAAGPSAFILHSSSFADVTRKDATSSGQKPLFSLFD